MAKVDKSISFKNATIDISDDSIIECLKDETKTYKLSDVLKQWDKVDGISIVFKESDDLPEQDTDEEGNE